MNHNSIVKRVAPSDAAWPSVIRSSTPSNLRPPPGGVTPAPAMSGRRSSRSTNFVPRPSGEIQPAPFRDVYIDAPADIALSDDLSHPPEFNVMRQMRTLAVRTNLLARGMSAPGTAPPDWKSGKAGISEK
jgi:hypothetical protein